MTITTEQDVIFQANSCVDSIITLICKGSIEFTPKNSDIFYAVGQFKPDILKQFREKTTDPTFWGSDIDDWLFENPILLWYLLKIECSKNECLSETFEAIKGIQNMEGFIMNSHCEAMRLLILKEPNSPRTERAIQYFINNWKSQDIQEISIGILALSEFDYFGYESLINEICAYILSIQNDIGYISNNESEYEFLFFSDTAYAIIALSRLYQGNKEGLLKSINWLIENVNDQRTHIYAKQMGNLLLALIAMGGGPRISLSEYEWNQELQRQKIDYIRPYFIHTSPLYQSKIHVKELFNIISSSISKSQRKILICSLYIDLLYEDLINKSEDNPDLEIKIITRPSSGITGMREKIARNVLKLLNISIKGNLRTCENIHCRMIIIDNKELIISSADLTRDQLYDEFNAGIYTKDKESISKAVQFFENLWEQSKSIQNRDY